MHEELKEEGIAHGNLKSSNMLFNRNMESSISEFVLTEVENEDPSFATPLDSSASQEMEESVVKLDFHGFGEILIELLTGKVVQSKGST